MFVITYERRAYESVDEKSLLLRAMSRRFSGYVPKNDEKKEFMHLRVMGTESAPYMLAKIDKIYKIDFIALNESRRIYVQFATNR